MGRGDGTTACSPPTCAQVRLRWPQPLPTSGTRAAPSIWQNQSRRPRDGSCRDSPGVSQAGDTQPQAGSGGCLRGHCLASGSSTGEDEVYLVLQE